MNPARLENTLWYFMRSIVSDNATSLANCRYTFRWTAQGADSNSVIAGYVSDGYCFRGRTPVIRNAWEVSYAPRRVQTPFMWWNVAVYTI
jgi:hypothetical protein